MELAAALHRNPWTNSNGIRRRFAPESLDENYWIMQLGLVRLCAGGSNLYWQLI